MFDAGMNALSGSAGTRNDLAAVDYFRRSAQKNYGPAEVVLGYLYDTGLIVVRDPSQAADWYRKAADAGDPLSQWVLGRLCVMASGLPRDDAAAQRWLTLSANQKNPFAAYLLGSLLSERDYGKAPQWFRMAAEQGLPQAQYSYAWTLKEGRGIDRDRVKAYTWFLLALDGGYPAVAERPWTIGGRALARPDRSSQNGRAEVRRLRQPLHRSSWMHRVGRGIQRDTSTAAAQNSEILPIAPRALSPQCAPTLPNVASLRFCRSVTSTCSASSSASSSAHSWASRPANLLTSLPHSSNSNSP